MYLYVRDIMSHPVISVEADAAARSALKAMDRFGIRHVPVTDGMKLVGVISDRDFSAVATAFTAAGLGRDAYEDYLETPVRELLKTRFIAGDIIVVHPDNSIRRPVEIMLLHKLSAVPVVDSRGGVVGVVSYLDILEATQQLLESSQAAPPLLEGEAVTG